MIQVKLKPCAGCKELKHIWKSHGKEKYCKECWYNIEKPKSIPPVSKKRKVEQDEYSKRRELFLIANPRCQAKLVGCTGVATDVHHTAGRTGENYLNMSKWKALCRNCHTWVELHPEEAKELGLSESRLTTDNMKKLFTPNVIMIVIIVLTMFFLSSCKEPEEKEYTYKVCYRTDSNQSDKTNSIEYLPNGGIRYTDENGRQIERFGTFYIVKLK